MRPLPDRMPAPRALRPVRAPGLSPRGGGWSDVQAGEAAGMRGAILLKTGRGTEQLLQARPEKVTGNLVFDNLPLAFEAIFSIDNNPAIWPQS